MSFDIDCWAGKLASDLVRDALTSDDLVHDTIKSKILRDLGPLIEAVYDGERVSVDFDKLRQALRDLGVLDEG